jgi:ankyrin repeat protein
MGKIIHTFNNGEYDIFFSTEDDFVKELFKYCLYDNDIELLKNILSRTNSDNLFKLILLESIPDREILDLFRNTTDIVWEIIISEMYLTDRCSVQCMDYICGRNKINLLEKMLNRGYKMNSWTIGIAIQRGFIDIIRHAILHNYNIQQIFNEYDFVNNKLINTDIAIIKLLVEHHIDISEKINDIFLRATELGNIDLVTYCVENNYGCDVNDALQYACFGAYSDIVIYLLEHGADITALNIKNVKAGNIKIFKILIDYGFCIPVEDMCLVFVTCFIYANDVTDILFLLEYGANPECIFHCTMTRYENIIDMVGRPEMYHWVNCYLEFIVSMGYISHIKYLSELNYEKILLELDRLFIVACANGKSDMVIYLLKLGANINTENNMAVNVACYFGHMDILKFLLEKIDLLDITENLLMVTIQGYSSLVYEVNEENTYAPYRKLRGKNNILRNDLYHFGNFHVSIFELLCSKNIVLTNFDIYEILKIFPLVFYSKNFLRYIISMGFDINTMFETMFGGTIYGSVTLELTSILELCVNFNNIHLVKYLLDNGADITINNNGPMQVANYIGGREEIKKLLLEYGAI